MMNRLFALCFAMASFITAGAVEIKDVFSAMPDSVLPTLTRNNRLDMVDFVASGMKAEVSDVFDGKATLDTLTADYLHLTLSEAVKVEMKLLPSSSQLADSASHVICMVMTYGKQPIESKVTLFTSQWAPLPSSPTIPDNEIATLSISSNTLTTHPMQQAEELTVFKWNGAIFNKD